MSRTGTPADDGAWSVPVVTQLTMPSAPFGMIERPRLAALVREGLAGAVTLVCAPAGSGKTALVAAVAADWPDPVAWVSLEPADDHPRRLWQAVLSAFEHAGAAPDGSALAALAAPVPESRDTFMPRLANALGELPDRVVLVLDDVHAIRSRECVAQLAFLLLHAPATLRVVLVARADPPLPLHLLRVRGQLAEIRAADLTFTLDEAAGVVAAHALALTDEQVRTLHSRTEGWGAGLRLAALGLKGHADPDRFLSEFAGDDRVVGDYLLAEVLDRQPPRLRTFLLRTSLVEQVSGGLADALTGDRGGAETLAELERGNGFVIGLDARREWYRYHRLFGRLLRARAERELADELGALHARAARWYADRGAAGDALRHATLAEDWDLALAVVAEHWFELYVNGEGAALRTLLGRLPAARVAADAEVSAALACAALEEADLAAAARHLVDAQAGEGALPEPRRRRCLETMALARLAGARLQGDYPAALAAADELLAQAPAHHGPPAPADVARDAVVRALLGETAQWAHALPRATAELRRAVALAGVAGLDYVAVAALGALGLLEVMEGGAGDTARAREAVELAERRGWSGIPQTTCAHVALAVAAFYDLRLEEADEHLARAAAAAAHVRRRNLDFMRTVLAARVALARGTPAEGLRRIDEFEALHRRGAVPPYERPSLASQRAALLVASGDLDGAEAALDEVRDTPWLVVDVARASVQLARGAPADALATLLAADEKAETHVGSLVEQAVMEAIARDAAGDPEQAGGALERALALAEASRYRAPFLRAGRRMERLLRRRVREGTAHRAVVADLLDELADRDPESRTAAPLLEPLSKREEAILRYLPTPLSNREIADELFVTTNTVKTHLRSIYRKLDVARRREAVERARDLRLLSTHARR